MGTITSFDHTLKNGTAVHIRNASEEDAAELVKLKTDVTIEGEYTMRELDELKISELTERDDIRAHLHAEGYLYIVAEIAGRIAGFVEFENGALRRTMHSGMLFMLINKDHRGKGIGTLLLSELISWAGKTPLIEKICLAVFSTNTRAIDLYTKLGFEKEGLCPHDMRLAEGKYVDSILMYKFVK